MAKEEYPIKLTWKQASVGILAALGMVGGIFTAGFTVQKEVSKVELSRIQGECQAKVNNLNLTLGKERDAAIINRDFYKDQYKVTKNRLKICIDKGDYVQNKEE